MFNENAAFLWLFLILTLFVCEAFVPYRKSFVFSLALAAVMSMLFSQFQNSLFYQCVFCIVSAFIIYVFVAVSKDFRKKSQNQKNRQFADVIVLRDIPQKEYGFVYCSGKSHIIKNDSGKFLKKCEVLQISKQDLE